MVLIAIANTPEDFRQEILKLLRFAAETQRNGVDNKLARRSALAALQRVIDDVERIAIVGKDLEPLPREFRAGWEGEEYRAGWTAALATLTGDELIAPTINLNGSTANSLIESYVETKDPLRLALGRLQETRPHGRDYQTAPEGAEKRAKMQHELRISAVVRCLAEIDEIMFKVHRQKREREK